ncbi:PQ-loop domain-containing transporter [Mycoplasmopsis hyopharyngis]|uniref:PQ-loop domain-containing transporter n=1 Tax=Mycoplasmopsis hyopharyngis TaxID=29558 RepID=UPI00387376C3
MQKFIEFFAMKPENQVSGLLASVFGLIAAMFTVGMGIPQLVKILKDKKVGEIKYYSFWIFFIAINGWVIFGGFTESKLIPAVYANALCSLLYIANLFALYRYSNTQWRKKGQWVVLGIAMTISFASIISGFIGVYWNGKGLAFDANTSGVLSTIVPMVTTFAFAPQILKSFETKNFKGMSIWLTLVFIIANTAWILYWIFGIANQGVKSFMLNALVWQVIQIAIYGAQFWMQISMAKKEKAQKNTEQPIVENNNL